MAQAVSRDEVELDESLLSQAKEKALSLQKDANGVKVSGDYVPAGKLTYVNPKDWKITEFVAVLIGSHELHVSGTKELPDIVGVVNEASFEVVLKDECKINEVELTLTFADGSVETRKQSLKNYARNVPISLKVGNLMPGRNKFELKGTECETLKKGLVIFGVRVNERALVPR